ncbi:MAG: hypothetical protein IID18_03195 [Nitrospinae bacterium]|nr:hypothetical protein [Nitrospinota bacterium]
MLFLEIPEDTPVGILGSAGFPENGVVSPFLFEIMAGSAFPGGPEKSAPVIRPNLGNMLPGIKFLVNMTTRTIFTDDLIVFLEREVSVKRTGEFEFRTTRPEKHQNREKDPAPKKPGENLLEKKITPLENRLDTLGIRSMHGSHDSSKR